MENHLHVGPFSSYISLPGCTQVIHSQSKSSGGSTRDQYQTIFATPNPPACHPSHSSSYFVFHFAPEVTIEFKHLGMLFHTKKNTTCFRSDLGFSLRFSQKHAIIFMMSLVTSKDRGSKLGSRIE